VKSVGTPLLGCDARVRRAGGVRSVAERAAGRPAPFKGMMRLLLPVVGRLA